VSIAVVFMSEVNISKSEIKKNSQEKNNALFIKGARVHNLKNIDLEIPKNKFVVVTGVSGSGKSSLTIDTIYAEGQRRYVESLTSYARQFLSRMDKPDVDYIKGLSPAIAIEQKVSTRTTRSTVGSLTELYDYLRLLYARIGKTYSPVSGTLVAKHEVSDVVDAILKHDEGTRAYVYFEYKVDKKVDASLSLLLQKGFTRVRWDNEEAAFIEDILKDEKVAKSKEKKLFVLVDRLAIKRDDDDLRSRLFDSIQTAFNEGAHECIVSMDGKDLKFNNKFEADGIQFEIPNPSFFNFNNPYGACKKCEGFGTVMGIDEDLIFPDKTLSIYEGVIAPWRGEKMSEWAEPLIKKGIYFDFPIHRAYEDLSNAEKQLLWDGNEHFEGLHRFFKYLEEKSYKIQYRVMLSRYKGRTVCPDCKGSRINKEAAYVKIDKKSISELMLMPITDLHAFFSKIKLSETDIKVSERILTEINNRLQTMMDVGLGYLNLNRLSNTLSGGETQRINLTRTLGSNLTSSLYILDEPSIGLHQKDTERLIKVLRNLRNLGNTVIVVEHDEDIMRAADHLIDIGPRAGVHGGEVMYNGKSADIVNELNSLTGRYLSGDLQIEVKSEKRSLTNFIEIKGASQHNLKNIDVKIPLEAFTVVSGVSGSGKTTLIKKILYPALMQRLEGITEKPGMHKDLIGDLRKIKVVELIDQNPLGKSSRSNPVTYVKAYDGIRDLFSRQQLSKIRGYTPAIFSFNIDGGRCDQCKGDGEVVVEMQFLADVHLLCESCNGKKFKEDVLEVKYNDKSIFEILELTVDEAVAFFVGQRDVVSKLIPLQQVGLGYIKLGQSSSTLSGGEAQRVKLASYLSKGSAANPVLFIFDEPTTGLHFHDISNLLNSFEMLIDAGHTVVVIEHNIDVIKCADWLIDLGPEGGDKGGSLLFQGRPEEITSAKDSHTAEFLIPKLKNL
jgi:excinuclease ABC subunit A